MITRFEVAFKPDYFDPEAAAVLGGVRDLGIEGVEAVYAFHVTYLLGKLTAPDKHEIAEQLLADTITQEVAIDNVIRRAAAPDAWSVEITFNRGVTDMVAETTLKGIADLGIRGVSAAKTARRYEFAGAAAADARSAIIEKLLMNKVIEHVLEAGEQIFYSAPDHSFELVKVPIREAAATGLIALSRERDLFLSLEEMQAIQDHFRGLGREPTDVELEMLAQTWSEHCSHKTLTGLIEYNGEKIDNLLKETVFRVTRELDRDWCLSVFKDNAGIIAFDNDDAVCFKVETHNPLRPWSPTAAPIPASAASSAIRSAPVWVPSRSSTPTCSVSGPLTCRTRVFPKGCCIQKG